MGINIVSGSINHSVIITERTGYVSAPLCSLVGAVACCLD